MHCSRITVNEFNRVFATFIWNSSYEPMRRSNLFRRTEDSGLGLGHIFVRQLIARWKFFKTPQHPFLEACKEYFLPKYTQAQASGIPSNDAIRLRGFYKEVADTIEFVGARFTSAFLESCSKKKLQKCLLKSLFSDPLYRLRPFNAPLNCITDVLKRVKRMPIPPKCKSFFFRFHSRTIPVKEWRESRGFDVFWSTNCRLCNTTETFTHAFVQCVDAVFFGDVFKRTVKKDFEVEESNFRYLHFGDRLDTALDTLALLGLYSLWKTRKVDTDGGVAKPSWVNFKNICIFVGQSLLARSEDDEWKEIVANISRSPNII
ncbi:unnamed protein product [Ixodes persulcatus]